MNYKLVFKSRAEEDLSHAITWYEDQQPGLGRVFMVELEKCLRYILKNPQQYPSKREPYREAFIKRFPFVIIYEVIEKEIIIYSVFNTYRNPEKKPR